MDTNYIVRCISSDIVPRYIKRENSSSALFNDIHLFSSFLRQRCSITQKTGSNETLFTWKTIRHSNVFFVSQKRVKNGSDWVAVWVMLLGSYFKLLNVQYCIFIARFPRFGVTRRKGKSMLKLLFVCLFASVYHFSPTKTSPGWFFTADDI